MIDLALKACIPLIHATTTDTGNVSKILKFFSGKPEVKRWAGEDKPNLGEVFYCIGTPWQGAKGQQANTELPPEQVKNLFEMNQASLVIVNSEKVHSLVFDAGELPTPKELKKGLLTDTLKMDEPEAEDLLAAMGGLTLAECDWALRLTHVQDSSLTRAGIARTRKKVFPPKPGLEQVNTDELLYLAPDYLTEWLEKEAAFFLKEKDHRLRPKGLLFDGPPGTGKTAGAKHVGRVLGVPVFRFCAADVKSKWVGESESNLKQTLQAAAHESPCVLLIDEMEKLFNTGFSDTSGVTNNLLGDFLWFLQENEARVLVIGTTNGKDQIPKPLIRPGRLDRHMTFLGLSPKELKPFMEAIAGSYGMKPNEALGKLVGQLAAQATKDGTPIPQADAEQAVKDLVKQFKFLAMMAEKKLESVNPLPKAGKGFILKTGS